MAEALTISEAADALTPAIPRRELARRLKGVAPVGMRYGRRGRKAKTFPVGAIFLAHAAWVREREKAAP